MTIRTDKSEIVEAWKKTQNAIQVGIDFGISATTVHKVVKEAGHTLRPAGRPRMSDEKRAQIVEALSDNLNAKQVASSVGGVSPMTVWHIARAEGISLKHGQLSELKFTAD